MLWRPSTYGEEMFLFVYSELGRGISVRGRNGASLDFLAYTRRFEEFARLSATLEVFLRCIRCAKSFHELAGHMPAQHLGSKLRQEVDVPASLYNNRQFCEVAKLAGQVASDGTRSNVTERNALRAERRECYICGVALTSTRDAPTQFTVDHIWPLTFGGQTNEENVLPACKDCNNRRGNMITWAWGPVQSTFHTHAGDSPPSNLRFSLAIARQMLVAAGDGKKLLTLKEAAKKLRPMVPNLSLEEKRSYVYFDFFQQCEAQI